MIELKRISDEVFVACDPIACFGDEEVTFLLQKAQESPRKRARICAHRSNDDGLHEMLIAISSESYIRPHRHAHKSESFHIVEGLVDVAIFDDDGLITDVIELGPRGSGRQFFYRLSESRFHTLLIRTDYIVMHETTNGPFAPGGTLFAEFAPTEAEPEEAYRYLSELAGQISQHLLSREI
jgi:cupin fold WbuC family metalloprotein